MIQKCSNCGEWVKADVGTSGGAGGMMAGGGAGAMIGGMFMPGIGHLVGGAIGGLIGGSASESNIWEFKCPNCGAEWTVENENEDQSEIYEEEINWKNEVFVLASSSPTLINSSSQSISEHIKNIESELSKEFINEYPAYKGLLYDALAYCQFVLQKNQHAALETIKLSLALAGKDDPVSNSICGMIKGITNKPLSDYETLKYLIYHKTIIDYNREHPENEFLSYFTESQLSAQFEKLTTSYVNHFLEIPKDNRRFLVVVDELVHITDTLKILPISNLPHNIQFPSGHPRTDELYVIHPYKPNEYIPYDDYQFSLFRDEIREFSWIMECLGAKSISFHETFSDEINRSSEISKKTGGGAEYKGYGANGNYDRGNSSSEYLKLTTELKEAKEYCITTSTPPYIPSDVVWYNHRPEWHRNCQSRKEGRLVKASFNLSTNSISATNAQEKKKIEAELKVLIFKANGSHEKEEQFSLRSEENHTWSVDVEFYPLSEYKTKPMSISSQNVNIPDKKQPNYMMIGLLSIIAILLLVIILLLL